MTAYYANINPATFVRLSRTNPKMSKKWAKNGQKCPKCPKCPKMSKKWR